jgi:hypothetical protein
MVDFKKLQERHGVKGMANATFKQDVLDEPSMADRMAGPLPPHNILPATKFTDKYIEFHNAKVSARKLQGQMTQMEKQLPQRQEDADKRLAAAEAEFLAAVENARCEHAAETKTLKDDLNKVKQAYAKASKQVRHRAEGLSDLLHEEMRNQ